MVENIFSENDNVKGIRVTQVLVFPFTDCPSLGHMRGLAQIVLNDCLQVRGLRIMEGNSGLFVSYPLDPFYKGEDFKSIVVPMDVELRALIEREVLAKYEEATK